MSERARAHRRARSETSSRLAVAGISLLLSCAAGARIQGVMGECERNPAQCEAECAQATGAVGPGRDTYCDALAVIRAEGVIRKAGQQPPTPQALPSLTGDAQWMGFLCDNQGVARACAARDGLRPLLVSSQAQYASGVAQDQERRAAIESKIAEIEKIASANPKFRLNLSLDTLRRTIGSGDIARAESFAESTLASARQMQANEVAAANATAGEKKAEEDRKAAIAATQAACSADVAQCERDCSADAKSDKCWALAARLADGDPPSSPPNPRRGREIANRSCAAGNESGCRTVQIIGNLDAGCSDVATCKARCDLGVGNACGTLGALYGEGRGVPKNYATASSLYKRGCDLDSSHACFLFASSLWEGIGVPKNIPASRDPMMKACDLGEGVVACQAYCELLGVLVGPGRWAEERCAGPMPHPARRASATGPTTSGPVSAQAGPPAAGPTVATFVGKHGEKIVVKDDIQVTVTNAANGAVLSSSGCGVTPYSKVVPFMTQVQGLVTRGDWAGLAAVTTFPLNTPAGRIPDSASFVTKAQAIFTPPVRAAVADAEPKAAFCNIKGFMLGQGVVWGNTDMSGRYTMTAVNAPAR